MHIELCYSKSFTQAFSTESSLDTWKNKNKLTPLFAQKPPSPCQWVLLLPHQLHSLNKTQFSASFSEYGHDIHHLCLALPSEMAVTDPTLKKKKKSSASHLRWNKPPENYLHLKSLVGYKGLLLIMKAELSWEFRADTASCCCYILLTWPRSLTIEGIKDHIF